MDQIEAFDFMGWQFLCSGEQIPSGFFHAAVRYRMPKDGRIRTLLLDPEKFDSATAALARAREVASQWALEKGSYMGVEP